MAGELPHYSAWIRRQRCAASGAPGPCHPHHALSGTTYSPDEPRPAKAIPGARKGGAQRAHDYFLIPLLSKPHRQFHDGTGFFEGWTPARRDEWEQQQVSELHERYEAEGRPGEPQPKATDKAAARRVSTPNAATKERARIVAFVRREAAQSHRTPDAAAALNDVADVLESAGGA